VPFEPLDVAFHFCSFNSLANVIDEKQPLLHDPIGGVYHALDMIMIVIITPFLHRGCL
jgi:hypothetical protein